MPDNDDTNVELMTPYFPSYSATAPPDIFDIRTSAIFGGSNPVLQPREEWPRCSVCDAHLIPVLQINVSSLGTPSEFRERIAVQPPPGQHVILQIFVCAEDEEASCFSKSIIGGGGEGGFLVRVVRLAPGTANTAAVHAARAEMGEDKFFIEQRVITRWVAGNPEMLHEAVSDEEYNEEIYQAHEPALGLKLLGYPVQGKFLCPSIERCPRYRTHKTSNTDGGDDTDSQVGEGGNPGPLHADLYSSGTPLRCLVQLINYEDENTPLNVIGNTWISQCEMHPDVIGMIIGGDW
ncbi:hypothetical protein C8Q74DRAFT_1221853 [Fomes fomentarius]|nr:hypothetical protein C8Q74DRAFT_1221853 [Fomes fomentarius]